MQVNVPGRAADLPRTEAAEAPQEEREAGGFGGEVLGRLGCGLGLNRNANGVQAAQVKRRLWLVSPAFSGDDDRF
jgi:hypothetical protein